jgi:hypothetical protein
MSALSCLVWRPLMADFTSTLTSNPSDPIEIYREEMDLSRFSSDTYRTLLRDFLRSKYANKKIDVVLAILGPALDFLLDNGDTIFPGTPIVFCGVDRKELGDRSLPPHVPPRERHHHKRSRDVQTGHQ